VGNRKSVEANLDSGPKARDQDVSV